MNNLQIEELKQVFKRMVQYYKSPISDTLLQMYAENIHKLGYKRSDVVCACDKLLLTTKFFPSFSEVYEQLATDKQSKPDAERESVECRTCNGNGIVSIKMPTYHADVAFRCRCDNGSYYQALGLYNGQTSKTVWQRSGYDEIYGGYPV